MNQGYVRLASAFLLAAAMLGFSAPASAQVVRQLTDVRSGRSSLGNLDDAGASVFAVSSTDPFGTNPRHVYQIFRWDGATGAGAQITSFLDSVEVPSLSYASAPSVSDNGGVLVFVSTGNLTGQNPDRSQELFRINADGSGLVQLTHGPSPRDGVIEYMYQLSGDGTTVAFTASFDYFGNNPTGLHRLFFVNSDGTNLRSISPSPPDPQWVTISDNASRITFMSQNGHTYGTTSTGSGLSRLDLNNNPGFLVVSYTPQISGNGLTAAIIADPASGACFGETVIAANYTGTNPQVVGCPRFNDATGTVGYSGPPDITDDGQLVVFTAFDWCGWSVWKGSRDGSGSTNLTCGLPFPPPSCDRARVAGTGNRIVFQCEGSDAFGGPNPDLGRELYAMNPDGSGARQLSNGIHGDVRSPSITPDGSRIVFASDFNLLGDPLVVGSQIYRMAPDGSELVRLTSFGDREWAGETDVSDDGSIVVFRAESDPLGQNPSHHPVIFAIHADGSGLRQLTPDEICLANQQSYEIEGSRHPAIAGNGSIVVFDSRCNFQDLNPGFEPKVFRVNLDGTGLAVVGPGEYPRIDAAGTWVVSSSFSYPNERVLRMRSDGTSVQEIPTSSVALFPDISANGDLVAYGGSASEPGSLFLYRASTGTTTQLTNGGGSSGGSPSISRDGSFVYFLAELPWFESNLSERRSLMRVEVATGIVERVSALSPCPFAGDLRPVVTNQDGRLAVFASGGNCTGDNPDRNEELFLVDRDALPRIQVSPGTSPTLVSWDAVSGPIRYDVIRGDVANLRFPGNGSVDLGPVSCIENDSPVNHTRGFEDAVLPAAGHAFFYVFRGSQYLGEPPRPYGMATSGEPELPSSGGCAN